MNPFVMTCIKSAWRHKWLVLAVAVVAGVGAVAKELVMPMGYSADALVTVTAITIKGETGSLVPETLSPKAYEDLLLSSSVMGQTIERLMEDKAFGDDEPPELEDFKNMVEVMVTTVDETTRPVNYSPLIRLIATAPTYDLAVAIVDTWIDTSMTIAGETAQMSLAATSETLKTQSIEYEKEVETIWKQIEEESSIWNIPVIQKNIDAKVALINTLQERRTDASRRLAIAEQKLSATRQDVMTSANTELDSYKTRVLELNAELEKDTSQWNTEVMTTEMDNLLILMTKLMEDITTAQQELASQEQQLITIQANLQSEEPYLLLARAPDDQSYWILKGSGAPGEQSTPTPDPAAPPADPAAPAPPAPLPPFKTSLDEIKGQVMVSQQLNEVYWSMKRKEQDLLSAIAGLKAQIESLNGQITDTQTKQQELESLLAKHKNIQDNLKLQLTMERERYGALGQQEVLSLTSQERELMLDVAGTKAEMESIDAQNTASTLELNTLQSDIAKHELIQNRLKQQEEIALGLYKDVFKANTFATAAAKLTTGKAKNMKNTIGLNRVSDKSYAIEERGQLGKKGRVILTTFVACMLVLAYAMAVDVGLPLARKIIAETK